MPTYFEGETITLSVEFRNAAGGLADPTTVVLRVRPMGLEATTYSGADVTKDAVGKYHRDIGVIVSGEWRWRWMGTGAVNAVAQGSFVAVADNT